MSAGAIRSKVDSLCEESDAKLMKWKADVESQEVIHQPHVEKISNIYTSALSFWGSSKLAIIYLLIHRNNT